MVNEAPFAGDHLGPAGPVVAALVEATRTGDHAVFEFVVVRRRLSAIRWAKYSFCCRSWLSFASPFGRLFPWRGDHLDAGSVVVGTLGAVDLVGDHPELLLGVLAKYGTAAFDVLVL